MAEIEKMNLESEDLVEDRLAQLKELMPEVFTESGIDFDKLRLELGDEVDEGQERYAFTWPGKMDAIRQSQTPSTATLRPCVEKSRGRDGEDGSFDSDNIYIEGDNLEVLKLLQSGYHGKVKMIYIDPPYNTGHDFVYKDKFGDTIENYKEQAGLANQSNADTSGRYHSDWCSMMYPRLRLARELLSDDGAIFISIDDNEVTNLTKIMDEIFGERCRIALVCHKARASVSNDKIISPNHNTVAFYAKSIEVLEAVRKEIGDDPCLDGFGEDDNDGRGPYRLVPVDGPGGAKKGNPHYEFLGIEGYWRFSLETMQDKYDEGLVVRRGNSLYQKYYQYKAIETRKTLTTWWDDAGLTSSATSKLKDLMGGPSFDTPKPLELIERMLKMITYADDSAIVLDFFSGSATTAHALMNINVEYGGNRQYILVQLPEVTADNSAAREAGYLTLTEIGEERIRRAGDKIKSEIEKLNIQPELGEEPKRLPDIGFRVFSLDNSGIEKPQPGQLVLDVVKPDRSDMDIVFEMMLKWGLELTLPVEKEEAAGYPVYSVACGELVCCLADGLTMEALDAIADMEPRRVLMRDSILTDTLKLNAVQAFRRVEERAGYEVQLRTV